MTSYKITQTEIHYTKADSQAEALRQWREGQLDGSGYLETEVEELLDPLKTYTVLSGTLYEIPATSKEEAMEKVANSPNEMLEGEALTVFYGSQPCEECSAEWGWHKNDEAGITYEGLKQAQNEAILRGITYAMEYLEDINYHDGANVLAEYLAFLSSPDSVKMPDWQSNFHAGHTLYSTECEG
jgi:hypothetical protein